MQQPPTLASSEVGGALVIELLSLMVSGGYACLSRCGWDGPNAHTLKNVEELTNQNKIDSCRKFLDFAFVIHLWKILL